MKEFESRKIRIDHRNIPLFDVVPEPDVAMRDAYPDAMEELGEGFPEDGDPDHHSLIFFAPDHAHDKQTH